MLRNSFAACNEADELTSRKHLTRLQVEGQVVHSARAEDATMHNLPASYAIYRRGSAEEGAVGCYEDVSSTFPHLHLDLDLTTRYDIDPFNQKI